MPTPQEARSAEQGSLQVLRATAETESDRDFFEKIPWCKDILDNPDLIMRAYSRDRKASSEDALFHETLNTERTVQAWISLYSRPSENGREVDDVRSLLYLGSGLSSHPGVCHGGIVATIMDEVMGVLLSINKGMGNANVQGTTATAFLNTTFIKPVRIPQVVLVTATFTEIQGRKFFLHAFVSNGEGEVLAKADSLFVRLKTGEEQL